ncbi:MAG: glutamine amidotransferase [Myxococcales bacterium]|nr:glutamine amidotransferase [Myxococcales bacterium]
MVTLVGVGRVLIIKTGQTVPNVARRRGDFELWIREGMGLHEDEVEVVEVYRGARPPAPERTEAIVVTGSAAMVTDAEAWSEATAGYLSAALEAGAPMLAICYGHQLLAHGNGGRVGDNPRGRQVGTIDVTLLPGAGGVDRLFGIFSQPLHVPVSHLQAVLELPSAARRLAWSANDENHAFSLGPRAWGVQFHPEFDADIVRGYIEARADTISAEGLDPDALAAAARDTDDGKRVLRRFAELVGEQG